MCVCVCLCVCIADATWGDFDILDVCELSGVVVNRSFYASKDGTCSVRTDGYVLRTQQCVGPFGTPRPWGLFTCEQSVTPMSDAWTSI